MQQTFEQFKQIIEQSKGSAPFEIKPDMIEQFYKEQCLKQIGQYMDMTLGFFLKNHKEMSPEQMYEWAVAIKQFFGIQDDREGRVNQTSPGFTMSEEEATQILKQEVLKEEPVPELSKEEKIEQAKKNLEKSGLWI